MKQLLFAFIGVAGVLPAAQGDTGAVVTAPAEQWTLSTGFDYTTGKYGQSSSTNIFTIPVIARYAYDRWTFKLTIPWTRISGPADVVSSAGLLRRSAVRPTTQTER